MYDPLYIEVFILQFKCCGAQSFEDWKYSKWLKGNDTRKTPDSCCKSPSEECAKRDHPSNIDYVVSYAFYYTVEPVLSSHLK